MRKSIVAICLLVLMGAAAGAQDLTSFNESAERLATALKSGDVEAISQMYADDARILPPGRDIIEGRGAIKDFWAVEIKNMSDFTISTLDVKPLGDSHVREIGKFTGKTTGSNPQEFTGKFITIWQKIGDGWQVTDDIWNLDK